MLEVGSIQGASNQVIFAKSASNTPYNRGQEIVCFNFGKPSHIGYQCPKKNNLHVLIEEEEEEEEETCLFACVICGSKSNKLATDSGSCMIVVFASTVESLKLITKPHPRPYKTSLN